MTINQPVEVGLEVLLSGFGLKGMLADVTRVNGVTSAGLPFEGLLFVGEIDGDLERALSVKEDATVVLTVGAIFGLVMEPLSLAFSLKSPLLRKIA